MTGLAAHILPFFHTLLSLFATGEQATIVFAGDAMQQGGLTVRMIIPDVLMRSGHI